MTKLTPTPAVNPMPTLTPEVLRAIVMTPEFKAVMSEMAKAKPDNTNTTDKAIIRAFEKAGFKNIVLFDRTKDLKDQPNCTVLTYKRWLELGRVVKKGEKSIRARGYHIRLFHRDQTEPVSAEKSAAPNSEPPKAAAKATPKAAKAVPVEGSGSLQ